MDTLKKLSSQIVNLIVVRVLEKEIEPIKPEGGEERPWEYWDRLYIEALDIVNEQIARIKNDKAFPGYFGLEDACREESIPRVIKILEGKAAYVIMEDSVIDRTESVVLIHGVYNSRKKARKALEELTVDERQRWAPSEITIDTPDRFEAMENEHWEKNHIALSIHAREIW